MTESYVLEVAIFKAKPDSNISQLREQLHETLRSFPGFIEFSGYCPLGDGQHADLVKWDSLASAKAAAAAFETGDSRFMPYMEAIEEVVFMGHFQPDFLNS